MPSSAGTQLTWNGSDGGVAGEDILDESGNELLSDGSSDCQCCWKYLVPCAGGTVDIAVAKSHVGAFSGAFKYDGVCYSGLAADWSTTEPGTAITHADVTDAGSCEGCEEGVTSCDGCAAVPVCVKISGYVDGDFVPTLAGNCATVAHLRSTRCHGGTIPSFVTPTTWDGSFHFKSLGGPCTWYATCDNTATGEATDAEQGGLCVSSTMLFDARVQRTQNSPFNCTSFTKTITLSYIDSSNTGSHTLWTGTVTSSSPGAADTYTRTGGDDTTATITLVNC